MRKQSILSLWPIVLLAFAAVLFLGCSGYGYNVRDLDVADDYPYAPEEFYFGDEPMVSKRFSPRKRRPACRQHLRRCHKYRQNCCEGMTCKCTIFGQNCKCKASLFAGLFG